MKYNFIILLFVVGIASCKKDTSTNTVAQPTTTPVNAKFAFSTFDVNGNNIILNNPANTFIINFSQNNNVIYSIRTKSNYFNINNFKDGGYIYSITDSLNLYSYTSDSIVSKNGTVYLGRPNTLPGSWSSGYNLGLGAIQIKPTFTLLNYTAKDTGSGLYTGIYIKVNVGGSPINGSVMFYFYKDNKVSFNNLYNYAPLYPNSVGHIVSNTQTSASDIFYDSVLKQGTSLISGDSVYFAVYSAPSNPSSYDYLAPIDVRGWSQFTSLGTQRIVIPYKLR